MKIMPLSINDYRAECEDNNLTLEQRGAYHDMIALSCRREADFIDDVAQTARMLGQDVRVFKRNLAALLEVGLVEKANGYLAVPMARQLIAKCQSDRQASAAGGRKSRLAGSSGRSTPESVADVQAELSDKFGGTAPPDNSKFNNLDRSNPTPTPKPKPNPSKREALSLEDSGNIECGSARASVANIVAFRKPEAGGDEHLPDEWSEYALRKGLAANEVESEWITFTVKSSRLNFGGWKVWVERALNYSGRTRPALSPTKTTSSAGNGQELQFDWDNVCRHFKQHHTWMGDDEKFSWVGPRPGDPDCRVPAEVLDKWGLSPVREYSAAEGSDARVSA